MRNRICQADLRFLALIATKRWAAAIFRLSHEWQRLGLSSRPSTSQRAAAGGNVQHRFPD
jgi:hypothetical protein